jgi:transglutaminase-like putative cysteine protease
VKRIEIRHTTRYGFGTPVSLGHHTLLLRPREGHDLRIASSVLQILPHGVVTWRRDFYDNVLAVAEFASAPCEELVIESRVEAELYDTMPLDFTVDDHALHFPFEYEVEERIALGPYLELVYSDDPSLTDWLSPFGDLPADTETFSILDRLNHRIQADFGYEIRETEGVLAPGEMLHLGKGSCRDMAAFFVEVCRRLGIAARFVSGYVHGPATEAGGAASHAWAEIYLPGAGWKGFDPTSAVVVGPDHIPVAVHRHPEAVPPVAGTFTGPPGAAPELTVDVQINQLPDRDDGALS